MTGELSDLSSDFFDSVPKGVFIWVRNFFGCIVSRVGFSLVVLPLWYRRLYFVSDIICDKSGVNSVLSLYWQNLADNFSSRIILSNFSGELSFLLFCSFSKLGSLNYGTRFLTGVKSEWFRSGTFTLRWRPVVSLYFFFIWIFLTPKLSMVSPIWNYAFWLWINLLASFCTISTEVLLSWNCGVLKCWSKEVIGYNFPISVKMCTSESKVSENLCLSGAIADFYMWCAYFI